MLTFHTIGCLQELALTLLPRETNLSVSPPMMPGSPGSKGLKQLPAYSL